MHRASFTVSVLFDFSYLSFYLKAIPVKEKGNFPYFSIALYFKLPCLCTTHIRFEKRLRDKVSTLCIIHFSGKIFACPKIMFCVHCRRMFHRFCTAEVGGYCYKGTKKVIKEQPPARNLSAAIYTLQGPNS